MTQATRPLANYRKWAIRSLSLLLLLLCADSALGADVRGGDDNAVFRLPVGQVISDDLYVTAGEIYIDGTVEGDLIAAGGYVEVNGTVTGDALLAGGGIAVNGTIQDDARLAGGGVTVAGQVGDDLFVAAGGPFWPGGPSWPIMVNGRAVAQGLQLQGSANIGGDAYLAGGQGVVAGTVVGNLFGGMGRLVFAGNVLGNAQFAAQDLQVRETGQVKGTLRYRSERAVDVPAGVAGTLEPEVVTPAATAQADQPGFFWRLLGWLWRTVLLVVGFSLLAWLLWHFFPRLFTVTTHALASQPVEVGLYGLVGAALLLPLILALIFLAGFFWGWSGALLTAGGALGLAGLLWLFSPLIVGHWVGQQLAALGYQVGPVARLIGGTLLIVLVARLFALIPCVGIVMAGMIYLLSFALALGSFWLGRSRVGVSGGNL